MLPGIDNRVHRVINNGSLSSQSSSFLARRLQDLGLHDIARDLNAAFTGTGQPIVLGIAILELQERRTSGWIVTPCLRLICLCPTVVLAVSE